MDILIQADGVTLTEAIKDAIDEKIGRVEQYAPRAVRARVRLRKVSAHPSPRQYTVPRQTACVSAMFNAIFSIRPSIRR